MPPKGRRRENDEDDEGTTGEQKEWAHPDAMPLEEVDLDAEYDGVVTNVSPYGIFVDFGAVKDALLRVPSRLKSGYYKKGMELPRLKVLQCDIESGKVVLQQDEQDLPESVPRPKKRAASSGPAAKKEASGGNSRARSASARKPTEWAHADGMQLEELEVGQSYEGTITNVSPYGVFVHIGAVRDARLDVPARVGRKFRIGDVVPGCKLQEIDVEQGRMSVLPENIEEVVEELPPKERPQGKAKAKAKPRGKSQPRKPASAEAAAPKEPRVPRSLTEEELEALNALEVGSYVDGVVSNRNGIGLFVDIGVGKDAKVSMSKKHASRYKKGDELTELKIEDVDYEKQLILVSMEIEDDGDDEQVEAKPKAKAKPKGKAKAKAQAAVNTKDWSHPGGKTLERLKAGAAVDGVVTNIGPQGVFVDIGAVKDGILKLPRRIAKQFRVGDEVEGMTILSVDVENEKVDLKLDDPELEEDLTAPASAPTPKSSASPKQQARAKGKAKSRVAATSPVPLARATAKRGASNTRATSLPPEPKQSKPKVKNWAHPDGVPLEDLQIGTEVSGVVTNCNPLGVFLDIGAVKDGKLLLLKKDIGKFRRGDKVEGMVIDFVDVDAAQLALKLTFELGDEPEEIDDEPPKASKTPQAKGAARSNATGPDRRGGSAPPARRSDPGPAPSGGGRGRGLGRGSSSPEGRGRGRGSLNPPSRSPAPKAKSRR